MIARIGITAFALAVAGWLAAPTASAGDAAAGKATYDTFCSTCHGPAGKGDGPVGASLNPKPRDFSAGDFKLDANKDGKTGTDADLTAVIKQGAGAFGGSPLMAPWGGSLNDQQVSDVIAYIRSLKK